MFFSLPLFPTHQRDVDVLVSAPALERVPSLVQQLLPLFKLFDAFVFLSFPAMG